MAMKKMEERRLASQPSPGLMPAPAADTHWGGLGCTGVDWAAVVSSPGDVSSGAARWGPPETARPVPTAADAAMCHILSILRVREGAAPSPGGPSDPPPGDTDTL